MAVSIEPAGEQDIESLLALLRMNGLPTEGLLDHRDTILVAREGAVLLGSAALEVYPDGALLRSVAVAAERQGEGLGRALTAAAIRMAEALEVPALYLLTTTAAGYFPAFGFAPVTRADVPAAVRTSVEFTSACPASATVMRKGL